MALSWKSFRKSVQRTADFVTVPTARTPEEEHPEVRHADVSRMDAETRRMYRTAQQAASERSIAEKISPESPPVGIRNPFQLGFIATLGVLLAILAGFLLTQLTTVLMYVVGALFIALGLEPIVGWLSRKGMKRGLAISLVYVALLGIIAGVMAFVIPTIVQQITQAVRGAPSMVIDISRSEWFHVLSTRMREFVDLDSLLKSGQDFASDPGNWAQLAGGVWQAGLGVANGVTATIIVLILSLYFLSSMSSMKRAFYQLMPLSSRMRVMDITEQVTGSVGRYVSGQVVIALTNSLLGFIMMTIVGVPFAAVVAVAIFCLALIPLVGALIGTALATTVALFDSPLAALIVLIYYLVYMQIEAYVITPRVMSRAVSVPGAFVVIGALVGGTLLGLLGALIAIPVTASIILIVKQVWIPRQESR